LGKGHDLISWKGDFTKFKVDVITDNPPGEIRSLYGTKDFRCFKLDAVARDDGPIGHFGTVMDWPE
jgi:hypothetical protein